MSISTWEHFFKPDIRSAGQTLFNKGKVVSSRPSDTEIMVFIRATPGFKVLLKTPSVESQTVIVGCTCPAAKKNNFCKHAWAALLAAEDKYEDFFECKADLEKLETLLPKIKRPALAARAAEFAEKQNAYKEKQASYRKEQYQKQKKRLKDFKELKKTGSKKPDLPGNVVRALSFFSDNGIELNESLDKQTVSAAKKKLARVFHPDFGGKHDEIVTLNNCADILIEYIDRQSSV